MTLDSKLGVGSTFSVVIPYGMNNSKNNQTNKERTIFNALPSFCFFCLGAAHLPPKQVKSTAKKSVVVSQLGQAFVEEALRWMPAEGMQEQHLPEDIIPDNQTQL